MDYKQIDLKNWNRKDIYEFYKAYEQPFFNVTANIDVTNLYNHCKKNNYSFFIYSLYISTKVANSINEFKIRIENGKPVIFEKINTGSTILKDDNTFLFVYLKYFDDFNKFNVNTIAQIDIVKKEGIIKGGAGNQGVIYHSTIPWISFTSVQHAQDSEKGRTVPKIVFGKYFNDGKKLLMPLSVEVHHALADGYHVGLFYEKFQNEIDVLK